MIRIEGRRHCIVSTGVGQIGAERRGKASRHRRACGFPQNPWMGVKVRPPASQPVGLCWAKPWVLPPPSTISRAEATTVLRSGIAACSTSRDRWPWRALEGANVRGDVDEGRTDGEGRSAIASIARQGTFGLTGFNQDPVGLIDLVQLGPAGPPLCGPVHPPQGLRVSGKLPGDGVVRADWR